VHKDSTDHKWFNNTIHKSHQHTKHINMIKQQHKQHNTKERGEP